MIFDGSSQSRKASLPRRDNVMRNKSARQIPMMTIEQSLCCKLEQVISRQEIEWTYEAE
jgi:hypothetical protein